MVRSTDIWSKLRVIDRMIMTASRGSSLRSFWNSGSSLRSFWKGLGQTTKKLADGSDH